MGKTFKDKRQWQRKQEDDGYRKPPPRPEDDEWEDVWDEDWEDEWDDEWEDE